jgi:hypothetical protein
MSLNLDYKHHCQPVYRPSWIAVVVGVAIWGGALLFVAYNRGFWPWGG